MRIRSILTVLVLGTMLTAAGCAAKSTSGAGPVETSTTAPTTAPTQVAKQSIHVYYANSDGSALVEKSAEIEAEPVEGKYLNALKLLNATDDSNLFPLAKGLNFKTAELKDGTLTVNLSIADSGRLGSGGEAMLMEALKKTVFQFSEVKALEILVDGKQTDSLMGHVGLDHPIKHE
jgi:hypothetical protein